MRVAPDTPTIERLRLAAALTHLVPRAALTVWPDAGPALSVSTDAEAAPDLSACHFRRLVADLSGRGAPPPGLSWVFAVKALTIEGAGVRHAGDGVVAVDVDGARRWWWATVLPADSIPRVLHESAVDMLEHARICTDVVADTTISLHVDQMLGVSVVAADLGNSDASDLHVLDAFVRQLSRACLVAELLHMDRLGCHGTGR